jgi:type VI secretion system VasD/TssJ family lipoprotein
MSNIMNKTIQFVLWGLFFSLLSLINCSSGPKQIQLDIQGTADMNNRKACVIYVYQLRTDSGFMNASSFDFWQENNEPFSEDIVGPRRRYQLVPGQAVPDSLTLTDETDYIGAVADFSDPDKEGWRRVFPVSKNTSDKVTIIVEHNTIRIY